MEKTASAAAGAAKPASPSKEEILALAAQMHYTPYLPFAAKQMILDQCVHTALKEREGIWYVDYIALEIAENLAYLSFYTDFTLEGELPYDLLCELGIFGRIKQECSADIAAFAPYITQSAQELAAARNALGPALARTVDKILAKLPSKKEAQALLNKIPKIVNKLDPQVIQAFAAANNSGGKATTAGQADAKTHAPAKKTPPKGKAKTGSDPAIGRRAVKGD